MAIERMDGQPLGDGPRDASVAGAPRVRVLRVVAPAVRRWTGANGGQQEADSIGVMLAPVSATLRRLRQHVRHVLTSARRVYALDVGWRAVEDHLQQSGPTAAAAMSYYALLSLFPLLIALVALLGLTIQDPALQSRVVDAILEQLPANANLRPQIERVVGDVAHTRSGLLGLASVIGALWTASGVVGALRRALNRALDVDAARPFARGKALDLLGVIGVMALALLSVVTTAALGILRAAADDQFRSAASNIAWALAFLSPPLVLSYATFVAVYRLIPNRDVHGPPLWLGALLAAAGFELAKAGFGLYVANFGRYAEVYGTLGGVVAFLVFVFLVSNIVILAAEVMSELLKDRAARHERHDADHRAVTH